MTNSVLLDQLEALEIPDCDCNRPVVPACMLMHRGQRCSPGCDCPHVPTPCEHVWHAEDVFYSVPWTAKYLDRDDGDDHEGLVREWAARRRAAHPTVNADGYREPADPPAKTESLHRAARVNAMSLRWGRDPKRPQFALRHPDDLNHFAVDKVSIESEPQPNGVFFQGGLCVYDPGAEEVEEDDCDPAMTERLARIDALVAAVKAKQQKRRGRRKAA